MELKLSLLLLDRHVASRHGLLALHVERLRAGFDLLAGDAAVGEGGAEGEHGSAADQKTVYEIREGEDDGESIVSAAAWVEARELEKPTGVYAIYNQSKELQFVGYTRNVVTAVRGAVGNGRALGSGTYDPRNGPLAVGNGVQNPVLGPFFDAAGNPILGADGTPLTFTGPGVNSNGGTSIAGLGRLFGLDVLGALDLSERLGLITTISEPNLTALSGETATFLAGGEFPIPISQGLGNVAIEYRNFGVSLAYTPTVLANGRISIRVRPEVSELSTQGAVTLNGFQVPALTIRRTETTVELGSGQSFMIAGLLSANSQNALDKAPGLGDVPILGNLFRSRSFNRGETELVIIVTPYLVKPVNAGEIKLPTDGYHSANEFEQLLTYQNQAGVSGEARPGPTAAEPDAPNPDISNADPAAIVPGSPQQRPQRADDSRNRNRDRQADAATPGFSL